MSEAPTHAAAATPTPARPQQNAQQNERTAQTERQAERTAQAERQAEDRTPQSEQRTQHTERTPQQSQRGEQQRSDVGRTDAQRTEQQRDETRRSETPRSEQHAEQRSANKLEDEWQAVQYEFVDDPKAAVRKADGLVTRALEELTSRHRSLTKQLEGNGDPQTEDLRLALHRYRELFKSLVAVK